MYEIFVKLLQKNGISSYKISKETGISQTIFSNWKSGRSIPKSDTMQKIANYFNVSIDYLMTGKESDLSDRKYYINDDTAKVAQEIFEKDKILFDVYSSVDKERLIAYAKNWKNSERLRKGIYSVNYGWYCINVIIMDDSFGVNGSVKHNNDDSYTIFIDARLSYEEQKEIYIHEVGHIMNGDFDKYNANEIEIKAHCIR